MPSAVSGALHPPLPDGLDEVDDAENPQEAA